MSPDAMARWRSFCGIFFSVTSRPFFLKMPAWLASVSGAKPVHPEIPMPTLTSSATAGADTRRAAVVINIPNLRMTLSSCWFMDCVLRACPCGQNLCGSFAWPVPDLTAGVPSATSEPGHEFVRLTGIDEAYRRQRPRDTPCVALDHKARRADCDIEGVRGLFIGHDGTDRMLGFRPWHMMQQPR